MIALESLQGVVFSDECYQQLIDHCRRKLRGEHYVGEVPERKAFGLIGGRLDQARIEVTHVFPLRRNLRWDAKYKSEVDDVTEELGIPSETSFDKRGWVSDPREIMEAQWICDAAGALLFANYHMHRVPWAHDPLRDTCTALDTGLAEGSGMWVLIVSMVNPDRPVVRAFFEGHNDREAAVRVEPLRGGAASAPESQTQKGGLDF